MTTKLIRSQLHLKIERMHNKTYFADLPPNLGVNFMRLDKIELNHWKLDAWKFPWGFCGGGAASRHVVKSWNEHFWSNQTICVSYLAQFFNCQFDDVSAWHARPEFYKVMWGKLFWLPSKTRKTCTTKNLGFQSIFEIRSWSQQSPQKFVQFCICFDHFNSKKLLTYCRMLALHHQ